MQYKLPIYFIYSYLHKHFLQFKPTVVKPFSFSLDKRLDERQKYDNKMQHVRKAQEEREKREKERRQKEEEEELKLQRKKLVPKVKICNGYIHLFQLPHQVQM